MKKFNLDKIMTALAIIFALSLILFFVGTACDKKIIPVVAIALMLFTFTLMEVLQKKIDELTHLTESEKVLCESINHIKQTITYKGEELFKVEAEELRFKNNVKYKVLFKGICGNHYNYEKILSEEEYRKEIDDKSNCVKKKVYLLKTEFADYGKKLNVCVPGKVFGKDALIECRLRFSYCDEADFLFGYFNDDECFDDETMEKEKQTFAKRILKEYLI